MKALALLALLAPASAHAYIPPSFFIYSKVAELRESAPNPSITFTVTRTSKGGTEEALGTLAVPAWGSEPEGWPVLSLLFSSNPEDIIASVQKFGLNVPTEQDLARVSKEQAAAMKEPPRPFYKMDKNMALKRIRQTYAWVHGNEKKSVWIEKDTFLPMKVAAPCPKAANELPWAKSGDNLCEVEFRNAWSFRRGTTSASAKIILMKDGQPLLYLAFDKLSYPKPGTNQAPAPAESTVAPEIRELALTFLH